MKNQLRQRVLKARAGMQDDLVHQLSRRIIKRLYKLEEFCRADSVLLYASFGGEVLTGDIINKSIRMGKKVAVPVLDQSSCDFSPGEITDPEQNLSARIMGCPTPLISETRYIPGKELDLALVPGVAFDLEGNRLGRGKGCYDRFLGTFPGILRIALAYELQLVSGKIPVQNHDCRMDLLITERRVLKFTPRFRLNEQIAVNGG